MTTTRQRAFRIIICHPLTLLAIAITATAVSGIVYWFAPPMPIIAFTIALGLVTFLSWPLIFFKSKAFTMLLYDVGGERSESENTRLEVLTVELEALGSKQGIQQLHMLGKKFENLTEVLKRRLNVNEATFRRYAGMAEQVYLAAIDNLHEVSIGLRSVSTINPDHISSRLQELHGSDVEEENHELEALKRRYQLFEDQNHRVASLLAQNEAAMTVLDKTATALADTKTGKGQASMDVEAAMVELERLAKQAGKYAK